MTGIKQKQSILLNSLCLLVWAYFEQHVLLTGSEVHLVLIVIHTQVDNVCQELIISIYHFQLLLQRLKDVQMITTQIVIPIIINAFNIYFKIKYFFQSLISGLDLKSLLTAQ